MHLKKLLLIITIYSLILISCGKDENTTNPPDDNKIKKSSKRGLAYNLTNAADLDTLKSGVSWWYNWAITTSAPANYYDVYQMEFIPMLWGGNTSNNDMTAVKSFILNHPEIKYLLVMNEPNLTDKANRTPEQAAADWLKYEQVISELAAQQRTIELVGLAMNGGTKQN